MRNYHKKIFLWRIDRISIRITIGNIFFNIKYPMLFRKASKQMLWSLMYKIPPQVGKTNYIHRKINIWLIKIKKGNWFLNTVAPLCQCNYIVIRFNLFSCHDHKNLVPKWNLLNGKRISLIPTYNLLSKS